MLLMLAGVVVIVVTAAAFFALLPRGGQVYRLANTEFEPYVASPSRPRWRSAAP